MSVVDLLRIPRTFRNLQRVREIIGVVVKYGWGDVVSRLGLENPVERARRLLLGQRRSESEEIDSTEVRIRLALEELGPTFIKLGQLLATRPDLVPLEWVEELRKLQDSVRPISVPLVRRQIEAELGRPIAELFEEFDDEPLAAASIAQVHRARLPGGTAVVVKVCRPHLDEVIERDLDILEALATLLESNVPELGSVSPRVIVQELGRVIRREVDFRNEARNLERFAANFADSPEIRVPAVHRSHSSERVLTMEYIDGIKASDFEGLKRAGIDHQELARRLLDFVLQQIFEDGFFHADLHPGNLFVLEGPVVAAIDMGMMGTLDRAMSDNLMELVTGLLLQDAEKVARLFLKFELIDVDVSLAVLRRDLEDLLDRYWSMPLGEMDIAALLGDLFELLARHQIVVPPELLLIAKTLATVEGLARQLDPELNPVEGMRPVILRAYLDRLTDPSFIARDWIEVMEAYSTLLATAPRDLRAILADLRRGRLGVEARVQGLERATRDAARNSREQAFALVTAAGFVSASLLIGQGAGPQLLGVPLTTLLALLGYGLSGAALFLLMLGWLRPGRF